MASPNTAVPHIAAAQNNKHITHNEGVDDLDEQFNDTVNVAVNDGADSPTEADLALIADEFNRNYFIRLQGSPTVAFTVTVPQNKRTFCISNETGQTATITTAVGGSPTPSNISLSANNRQELYSDAVNIFARAPAISI